MRCRLDILVSLNVARETDASPSFALSLSCRHSPELDNLDFDAGLPIGFGDYLELVYLTILIIL